MNTIEPFFNYCDALVKNWISYHEPEQSSGNLITNDPFLRIQKDGNGLLNDCYFKTMPEPFLGNPDKCSIVFINLNPGYTEEDKEKGVTADEDILSVDFAKSIEPYSDYAKPFPHLGNAPHHISGAAWWHGRNDYLKELVKTYCKITGTALGEKELDDIHPFSIELCPWHSKNWSESGIRIHKQSEVLSAIREHTLEPAMYAVNHSKTDFAVGIGNDILNALLDSGFSLAMSWGPATYIDGRHFKNIHPNNIRFANYPQTMKYKNKGKENEVELGLYDAYVFYRLLTKDVDGHRFKVLCISKMGSNNTPGPEYRELGIEETILRYISQV